MALTTEDLDKLKMLFKAKEHEFLRGFVYLTEFAIVTRIEKVDPAWQFEITSLETRPTVGEKPQVQVTCRAALTILGTTRHGVGQAKAYETKAYSDNKTGEMKATEEANEAEKSAATDALKRAARLFGIGRYLLKLPKDIENERDLGPWLQRMLDAKAKEKAKAEGFKDDPDYAKDDRILTGDNRMPNLQGDDLPAIDEDHDEYDYQDEPGFNDSPPKEHYTTPTNIVVTKKRMGQGVGMYQVIEGCSFFTREAFRLLGYGQDIIDSLGEEGVTKLPDSITIVYKQMGDMKSPLRVRRNSINAVVDVTGTPVLLATEG